MRCFSPELLRQARRETKMSQPMLARKTGLSRGTIAAIENGVNMPLCNTLAQLAWALGKPESYFFIDDVQNTKQISPVSQSQD